MEKRRIHAEFQDHRAAKPRAQLIDQLAHEGLRSLGVVDVARAVLKPQNLPGLGHVRQERIVTGILGMMRVETVHRPSNLVASSDYRAININRQPPQTQLLDLVVEQLTIDPHQCRTQASLG